MGVLARFAGRGIGTALLESMQEWARGRGLRRLELSVISHHLRAIALYLRTGFVIEGRAATRFALTAALSTSTGWRSSSAKPRVSRRVGLLLVDEGRRFVADR